MTLELGIVVLHTWRVSIAIRIALYTFLQFLQCWNLKDSLLHHDYYLKNIYVFVITYIKQWHMKNTNFQFPAQTKMGAFFTRRNHPLSNEKVTHIDHRSHCGKVQKYNRAKYVSNFLICWANNVVEHYGKRIEILHGCPFEGWPSRAWPSHTFWQKGLQIFLSLPLRNDIDFMFFASLSMGHLRLALTD